MALQATIEKIETADQGTTAVVTLTGMLTLGANLQHADEHVKDALNQGARNLVLDLTGVPYSDSAGLGMLVHTHGVVKANHGQLRLCGAGARIRSMLKMTATDRFLTLDEDRSASLAALGIDSITGSA